MLVATIPVEGKVVGTPTVFECSKCKSDNFIKTVKVEFHGSPTSVLTHYVCFKCVDSDRLKILMGDK